MKIVYTCYYVRYRDTQYRNVTSEWGLDTFKDGFWLDKDQKLAVEACTEAVEWIPPCMIRSVEKIRVPE